MEEPSPPPSPPAMDQPSKSIDAVAQTDRRDPTARVAEDEALHQHEQQHAPADVSLRMSLGLMSMSIGSTRMGDIRAKLRSSLSRTSTGAARRIPDYKAMYRRSGKAPSVDADSSTELAFLYCSYTLKVTQKGKPVLPFAEKLCRVKTKEKRLLNDVSASVAGGRVLAVMGPSGAGKTTMLNMLTLERGKGRPTGFLTLNGQPLTPALYSKHCAVVTQKDTLWTFLSCRDHLRVAIDLYRPSLSRAEREVAIDDLLDATGLMSCQHTKAGNMFFRGLSGGQKRRLSLACALAKSPSVIFLDEPTSGLDSAAAAKIMAFLKAIAQKKNIAIVCTIHAPSASVFEGFDDTLILSAGRIAYFGPAAQLGQHLSALGRPVPPNANPAEYALDVVNADFTSAGSVKAILDAWPQYAPAHEPREPRPLAEMDVRANFALQTAVLLRRHAALMVREPVLYVARLGMIFCTNLFFSIVWIKTREYTQEVALQKFFMMAFCVGVPALYSMIAVYALNVEFVAVRKEIKDGMYSPNAYALANVLLQVPAIFLLAVCALVPPWAVCDLHWPAFAPALLVFGTLLFALECTAQALSLIWNPLLGMLVFITHWFVSFLFSGVFVRISSVFWPLRALCYATPMRWGLPSLIYQIYAGGKEFAGADDCTQTPALGPFFCHGGFYCRGTSALTCYGKTGEQVLDMVGMNFDVISSDFTMWRDLAWMALIALFWKTLFVIQLNRMCAGGATPATPEHERKRRRGAAAPEASGGTGANCAEPRPAGGAAKPKLTFQSVEGAKGAEGGAAPLEARASDASENTGGSSTDLEATELGERVTGVHMTPVTTHQKTFNPHGLEINREAKTWKLQSEPAAAQTELAFVECNYSLTVSADGRPVGSLGARCGRKTRERKLLSNVSASVSAGHVLAVMGPSGAGKTTLLNMLTLEPGSGDATGFLTLNGHPLTPALYAQHCAVVNQQDLLWTFLTCRDHLRIAIELYRPELSPAEKSRAIDDLLDATGLAACQHTKAGNDFFRGLSGGQKRRLSLAIALAKRPSVIFLDEPTSGLDSAAAAKIMTFMKEIAVQAQIAIFCTIHQPAASVFEGFDDTLILSAGRIAYFGPASQLVQHLERVGRPLPLEANPAEYALDVVNADFTSKESVAEVLDAWPKYAPPIYLREQTWLSERAARPGFAKQVGTLLLRHAALTVREPMLYTARMVVIFLVTVFFCVVYKDSRHFVQEQVMQKAFYVFWLVSVPVSFPVTAVYALNAEFVTVRKEVKDGMYGPMAYALANGLLQVPMMFAFGLCALLPTFLILNWPWGAFGMSLVVFSAHSWAFECIAQFFSLTPNPLVGMLKYLNVWFISALFSGLVFKGSDVIWPIRLLYYCLPMKWFFSATAYSIMKEAPPYVGTVLCEPRPESGICVFGFECPNDPFGLACFGSSGTQILDSLHANYDAVSSTNTVATDLSSILCIGLVFKLSYLVYLYAGCTGGLEPAPPQRMAI